MWICKKKRVYSRVVGNGIQYWSIRSSLHFKSSIYLQKIIFGLVLLYPERDILNCPNIFVNFSLSAINICFIYFKSICIHF